MSSRLQQLSLPPRDFARTVAATSAASRWTTCLQCQCSSSHLKSLGRYSSANRGCLWVQWCVVEPLSVSPPLTPSPWQTELAKLNKQEQAAATAGGYPFVPLTTQTMIDNVARLQVYLGDLTTEHRNMTKSYTFTSLLSTFVRGVLQAFSGAQVMCMDAWQVTLAVRWGCSPASVC